jgi:hypothetical protein
LFPSITLRLSFGIVLLESGEKGEEKRTPVLYYQFVRPVNKYSLQQPDF